MEAKIKDEEIVYSSIIIGKSKISKYADFLIETDWVAGQIMKAVDDSGITENTIIIFTADNGTAGAAGFSTLAKHGVNLRKSLRGNKGQIYDGGHRVPYIVRWPKNVKAGSQCNELICLNDFMATVADITGAELPKNTAEDSFSILPLIKGEANYLPQRPMVVHHDYRGNFAIRHDRWKLIAAEKPELYDMIKDRKETTNIADKRPDIVRMLQKTLKEYRENGRSVIR